MSKVKFYSINDMSCGYNLKNCEILLKEYESGKEAQGINDMIELYNIKKFFDNQIYLIDWTLEDIKRYENTIKLLFRMVARFFKSIDNDSFASFYNEVELSYKNDFWELIEKFNVYEKITEERFREFINPSNVWLHELLKHKNITEHFGQSIRDYMLNDPSSAELILDKYEMKHIGNKDAIFFPKQLSKEDKETIINNYLDIEKPNLNYIRLITNIQSNKDKIEISPKTLLKSRRKVEELEEQFFNKNSGILMETTISFSKLQDEVIIITTENQSTVATYSTKWIDNNIDCATLLNNFIYLFEFVDLQMRCTFLNKVNQLGVFERIIVTTSQNAYIKGFVFEQANIFSLLQLTGYYNQLFSLGVRLEEALNGFFKNTFLMNLMLINLKLLYLQLILLYLRNVPILCQQWSRS